MKIAIIGDTHGFHKSIDKFLSEEQLVNFKIHTGDVAGGKIHYFLNPAGIDESIKLLQSANTRVIQGNHDRWVVEKNSWYVSDFAKKYLRSLPTQIIIPNYEDILFQHSMPSGESQSIPGKEKFQREMDELEQNYLGINILFHGHSHISSITSQNKDDLIINNILVPKTNQIYILNENSKYIIDVGTAFNMTPGRLFNKSRYAVYNTESKELVFREI